VFVFPNYLGGLVTEDFEKMSQRKRLHSCVCISDQLLMWKRVRLLMWKRGWFPIANSIKRS